MENFQLKALGAEGMTRELLHYLHIAEKLFCHTNTYMGAPIYNTVLHSLIEAEEVSASNTVLYPLQLLLC